MNPNRGDAGLARLRWATLILPIVFVWLFEVVRSFILDPEVTGTDGHVIAAMIMGGAIVVFATLVSIYLDRTQKQLVAQNKDLTVTHAVSSAVRGGLSLSDILEQSLDRLVTQTGALAGIVTIISGEEPLVVRRPAVLDPGLAWLGVILDEAADPAQTEPVYSRRQSVDTGILDLPLIRGAERIGRLRLAFYPPVEPDISHAAFADIAGEIAGAVQLGLTVTDLHRRERERAALYAVALQLTGRNDLRDVLDTITMHARELLGAERAIACLSDARPAVDARGHSETGSIVRAMGGLPEALDAHERFGDAHAEVHSGPAQTIRSVSEASPDIEDEPVERLDQLSAHERLAMADDGSICLVAHDDSPIQHAKNPTCPLVVKEPGHVWAARPLRSPDGILGELCVVREGRAFSASERTLLGALADMAAIAVRTARLHEAEEQWTIHAERDRIARELHDSLAQVLGVIHLQLRTLETRAKDEASIDMADELSSLAEVADEAYRDVREAILGLRETVREDDGLEGSLREYLRKYSRQTGIAATVTSEGDTRRAFSPRVEIQLLRVVQEALTNTRKHSRAHRVSVRIGCIGPKATVTIEDDGVGFDPALVGRSMEGGFGLASMRERVEQVGGTLTVHTAPNEGTRIVVALDAEDTRGTPSAQAPSSARR